jgi:sRNA-binding protein
MAQIYEKQLQEIIEKYPQWKQQNQAAFAERAKRTSQLTMPAANYAGTYRSDILGTIEIIARGNDLQVKMGNIDITATPFTQKDTVRVEMIPGQGEVIKFNKNPDGTIGSLEYSGAPFTRTVK